MNADDLGKSSRVNTSTAQLMENNRITSATILANGPALGNALRTVVEKFRHCSYGVHINLTEGPALTDGVARSAITDRTGNFTGSLSPRTISPHLYSLIYMEMRQQVLRLKSRGIAISHLDSHHHIHTLPWITLLILRLAAECGVSRIRLSKNLHIVTEQPSYIKRCLTAVHNTILASLSGIRTTDYFTSTSTLAKLSREKVSSDAVVEAMVHPGNHEYRHEVQALHDIEMRNDIELITYTDV